MVTQLLSGRVGIGPWSNWLCGLWCLSCTHNPGLSLLFPPLPHQTPDTGAGMGQSPCSYLRGPPRSCRPTCCTWWCPWRCSHPVLGRDINFTPFSLDLRTPFLPSHFLGLNSWQREPMDQSQDWALSRLGWAGLGWSEAGRFQPPGSGHCSSIPRLVLEASLWSLVPVSYGPGAGFYPERDTPNPTKL